MSKLTDDQMREAFKLASSKFKNASLKRAKSEASMTHSCGLLLHGFSNFGAIVAGIQEQQEHTSWHKVWLTEMNDRWGDEDES